MNFIKISNLGWILALVFSFNIIFANNVLKIAYAKDKMEVNATKMSFSEKIAKIIGDEKRPKRPEIDDKYKTIVMHKSEGNNIYDGQKLLFTKTKDDGGTLLFSDSPEYVTENGILYRDVVNGDVRLLYYHLNDTYTPKRLAVVAQNMDKKPVEIKITRQGVAGPSSDYLKVGKETLLDYFSPQKTRYIHLDIGQARVLNPMETGRILNHDGLVYGIYDMHSSGEVQFSVVMADAGDENMALYSRHAPLIDMDKHRLRGSFSGMNREITTLVPYDLNNSGKAYVDLADNRLDLYKNGMDMMTHENTQNYGNYGVLYKIKLDIRGKGQTSYYLKPRGGVYAGAILARNLTRKKDILIPTPADTSFIGEDSNKNYYAYLGTYPNDEKIEFYFTPPGASNLPAQLILIPEEDD